MVKKAKTDDAVAESSAGEQPGRRLRFGNERGVGGLFGYTLFTVLGSIIAVLAGAWAVQTRVIDVMAVESGERLAGIYANQYAGFYNQIFTQATRQLGGLAGSSDLAQTITSGDDARIHGDHLVAGLQTCGFQCGFDSDRPVRKRQAVLGVMVQGELPLEPLGLSIRHPESTPTRGIHQRAQEQLRVTVVSDRPRARWRLSRDR